MTDDEREREIERECMILALARSAGQRKRAWARMQDLIQGRSPQQIAKMERERGLCAPSPHGIEARA